MGSWSHRRARSRAGANRVHPALLCARRERQYRYWAFEGLAYLATDDLIDPLIDNFQTMRRQCRERAACSLAQSGMLNREQRMRAVPRLLDFAGDGALDDQTRSCVFQPLS